MPEKLDRNNGYVRRINPIPTLDELRAESDEIKARIKFGLTDQQIVKHRTRPHISQEKVYKQTYGISIYEYEEMFFAQDGKCAICRQEQPGGKLLATDHCHKSGKVRGLLCTKCNQGLGHFKDSIPNLRAALEYLRLNG